MVSKVVIIGASSGVGRALANRCAAVGSDLVLVARSERDVSNLCSDLRLKYGIQCYGRNFDVENTDLNFSELFESCMNFLGYVDTLLLPAGYVDSEDTPLADWRIVRKVSHVNYLGIVKAAQPFIEHFIKRGKGQIVGFSSIAAIAPRGKNTIYASAKIALESYFKGLRHYLLDKGVIIKIYALGYVDTSMSYGQKIILPACSAEKVAEHVVSNLDSDFYKIYYPRYWALVAWVLRHLPLFVYNRLKF